MSKCLLGIEQPCEECRMCTAREESAMKKYELTEETKVVSLPLKKITLHRIRALISFGDVAAGQMGGWIEEEKNLSHTGDAWVYGNAKVYGNARVYGDAWVYGNAEVCGDAEVCGNAEVWYDAKVCGKSHVLVIGAIGSRNAFTTFYRDKDNDITVKCGCFNGKITRFLEQVKQTHGDNRYAVVYRAAAEFAKVSIDLSIEPPEEDNK